MHRRLPLLLAALLAGCVAAPGTDPTPPTGSLPDDLPPLDLAWGLSGCAADVAFLDVPADAVRPHLPEGFEPVPLPQGLLAPAPNPTGEAAFGIELFTCASGLGLDEEVAPIPYGSYFAVVRPPEELREDVDVHFVKWDVLIPDGPRRDLLAAHGVPARNGSVEFATFDQQGPLATVSGTLVLGNATHTFEGSSAAPGPLSMSFVEYTQTPIGLVAWRTAATLTASGIGRGEVDVPEGSLATEILGAGTHPTTMFVFQGDFRDGTIRTVEAPDEGAR